MACYEYKGVKYTEGELIKLLQSQQLKTRRILELQSDLFQKGRDKGDLTNSSFDSYLLTNRNNKWQIVKKLNTGQIEDTEFEYTTIDEAKNKIKELQPISEKKLQNQFLQLLNKDSNWVTFFIKSIIQDTAKQTITEVQQEDVEAKVRELEKEGLLEIDCKGKLKAEKGLNYIFY